ncbi:unnamed protein product [Cuscuta europaea]|uniref:Uncharacterized protein n=1 Tax=Cuscuta europaea TaxID=41803 RepID=A0A9P0ZM15_CUSEU|nr:unnamed protein product [Cuscuta europaea]
MKNKLRDGF